MVGIKSLISSPFVPWLLMLPILADAQIFGAEPNITWTGEGTIRLVVETSAIPLKDRDTDELPAEVKIDFVAELAKLGIKQLPDLATLQVIEFDPATGQPRPYDDYAYQRSPADRPFRWLDAAVPYDFPEFASNIVRTGHKFVTRPRARGGYFLDVEGDWRQGRLTWLHTQRKQQPSHYAIYFSLLPAGTEPVERPPQGWIGDGLHRCDLKASQTISSQHARVDVVDWDGDELLDLVVGEDTGHLRWLKNVGTRRQPRFTMFRLIVAADGTPIDVGFNTAVKVTDWDTDGDLDLLIGTERNRIVYFENTGDNRRKQLVFRGVLTIDEMPLELPVRPLVRGDEGIFKTDYYPVLDVVDWDGDGDRDLLAGGYITGRIYWFENVSSAKGQSPQLKLRGPLEADGQPLNVSYWCAAPTVADFDGDGDLDLISGNFPMYEREPDRTRAGLKYYENIGNRTRPELAERPFPLVDKLPSITAATPRAADWDADGDLDLVVSASAYVYLFRNEGSPQKPKFAASPGLLLLPWGPASITADQFLDYNSDGRPDVLANYSLRLNSGRGNPWQWNEPTSVLPAGEFISHPSKIGDDWFWPWLDDFDHDGKLDVLFGTWHGNIWFHRNLSTPKKKHFDTTGVKLLLADRKELKVGPIDADPATNFAALQGARTVFAPADFDRDGVSDLVVGDTFGKVRYFRNVGTTAEPRFDAPIEMGDLGIRLLTSVCDWNRDGWPDVIAGAANGNVRVYLNRKEQAGPRFEAGFDPKLPPIMQPRAIVVDLNGDGDDDLFLPGTQGSSFIERSFLEHGYAQAKIVRMEKRP